MDFCQNCNNTLYPIENEEHNKLELVCKICEFKTDAKNTIVKKNTYKKTNTNYQSSNRFLIYENTYPRTKKLTCPNTDCPSIKDKKLQEAIYFNDPKNLKITYICCACNTEWKP